MQITIPHKNDGLEKLSMPTPTARTTGRITHTQSPAVDDRRERWSEIGAMFARALLDLVLVAAAGLVIFWSIRATFL